MKTHKHCASKILATCKWTTLASMSKHIMEESDGVSGRKKVFFFLRFGWIFDFVIVKLDTSNAASMAGGKSTCGLQM